MRHAKPQVRGHKHNSDSRKGHEQIATVQIYLHADLSLKEKAIAKTDSPHAATGRYRAPDSLIAFLDSL